MTRYLITGANRGIGLALTSALLGRGDHVWAAARDPDRAQALHALATSHPGRLTLLALDVADPESTAAAKAALGDAPIDVLICNAGVIGPERQSTMDMDFDGFRRTLEVNTLGPLRVVQAFLPNLKAGERPKIAIISSRMGSMSYGKSDSLAYRTSKAAVNKIAQALATDLGPEGVAVAALHPGWVRTDMGGSAADISAEESAEGLRRVIDGLTLDRAGRFIDYAGDELTW